MKMTAVLLVLAIGAAIGYLLGTESGREQKEIILVKLGRGGGDDAEGETAPAEAAAS